MMSLSRVVLSTSLQKPGICPAIAVRTSASVSFRSFTKAGTRSLVTTSSSTAFAICRTSANIHAFAYSTNLFKSVGHHVSDTPALVFNQTPQRRKKDAMTRLLLFWHNFCDGDQYFHRQ